MAEEAEKKYEAVVDIGMPYVVLKHFGLMTMAGTGFVTDGEWSVTWKPLDRGMQRVKFRAMHAAWHYAERLQKIEGCFDQLRKMEAGQPVPADLSEKMRHAEAHAHECDAAWPARSLVPFVGGPSIVDDSGTDRLWLAQAPFVSSSTDELGRRVCEDCGEFLHYEFQSSAVVQA